VRVAAWNVEGRLASYLNEKGGRGTPEHILRGIEALDADILVLPEAYNGSAADPSVDKRLEELNYDWFDTPYDDPNREEEIAMYGKSHIRLASRLGFVSKKVMRFGGERTLLVGIVEEPESKKQLQVIATHLEDRSEAQRQRQIDDIVTYINASGTDTVLLGDLNAMWPGIPAALIGSFATRIFVNILPPGDLKSELSRLREMATGSTMRRLCEEATLRDADPRHRATVTPKKRNLPYLPGIRLCQIDHILISRQLSATDFRVWPDGGSDHRAISAFLSVSKKN